MNAEQTWQITKSKVSEAPKRSIASALKLLVADILTCLLLLFAQFFNTGMWKEALSRARYRENLCQTKHKQKTHSLMPARDSWSVWRYPCTVWYGLMTKSHGLIILCYVVWFSRHGGFFAIGWFWLFIIIYITNYRYRTQVYIIQNETRWMKMQKQNSRSANKRNRLIDVLSQKASIYVLCTVPEEKELK
jgi:hypothetical protein